MYINLIFCTVSIIIMISYQLEVYLVLRFQKKSDLIWSNDNQLLHNIR